MQKLLGFEASQLVVNPLCLDTSDFVSLTPAEPQERDTVNIGYLARLAPEKGLDILVDAFLELAEQVPQVQLKIAGWLGPQHEAFWKEQQTKLDNAGLNERYEYLGEVDRQGKLDFLRSIDVLSVPTPYLEPKGLFLLEALAAGVPYVQPAHGAFPELHERLGGGVLFPPESASILAETLGELISHPEHMHELGIQGRKNVLEHATSDHEALAFVELLRPLLKED